MRWLLVVVVVLACVTWESRAVWASQKLFLKDGTYQLVSSYEVHGDRVRYYSVERSAWEEIPLIPSGLRGDETSPGRRKSHPEERTRGRPRD